MNYSRKKVYETPETLKAQVELEGPFCGSIEIPTGTSSNANIENQEVNTDFNTGDFGTNGWD